MAKEVTETFNVQLTFIHRDCTEEDIENTIKKIDWVEYMKRDLGADDAVISNHRLFIMDKE